MRSPYLPLLRTFAFPLTVSCVAIKLENRFDFVKTIRTALRTPQNLSRHEKNELWSEKQAGTVLGLRVWWDLDKLVQATYQIRSKVHNELMHRVFLTPI